MGKISPFKAMVKRQALTPNQLVQDTPVDVVLTGLFEKDNQYFFKLSAGQNLLASGKALQGMAEDLIDEYGTVEKVDAELDAAPFAIRIYPLTTLKSGWKYRRVEILGEVDKE